MWRLWVVVGVACSHNEPTPEQPLAHHAASPETSPTKAMPPVDPAPCEQAIAHAMKLTPAQPTSRDIVLRHCKADEWSLEARRCFLAASNFDQALPCVSKMTTQQVDAVDAELMTVGDRFARPAPQP